MTDSSLAFFVGGQRVGLVLNIIPKTGFFRGQLTLDQCPDHAVFSTVVKLAADVDSASPSDYQTAWEMWRRGCGELEDLQLWIGNGPTQVEEFTIESDWSIEWRNMDPEFVGL